MKKNGFEEGMPFFVLISTKVFFMLIGCAVVIYIYLTFMN